MRHCGATVTACNSQSSSMSVMRNAFAAKHRGIAAVRNMNRPSFSVTQSSETAAATPNALTYCLVTNLRVCDGMPWPLTRGNAAQVKCLSPTSVPYHFLQPSGPFFTPCYWNSRTFGAILDMDQVKHGYSQVQDHDLAGSNKRARTNSCTTTAIVTKDCHSVTHSPREGRLVPPLSECKKDKGHSDISVKKMKMTLDRLRTWDYTDVGRKWLKHPSTDLNFTLMSYNVLAQCLLEENQYLYGHCHPDVLKWEHRKMLLLAEIKRANADILCLQEVQTEHFNEFFIPEMEKIGYSGVYKKRTGKKNDGCAIFYRKTVFVLDASSSVEFCRPGMGILDRDNIAMVVMLRPKGHQHCDHKICVANTHLLFNPGRGDIKLAQLQILLAEIDKFAFCDLSLTHKTLYHPVILCGDMNSEPDCPLYRFVGTGVLHYEGLVSGDISGQTEGVFRGRFLISKELVPPALGISDQCQYIDIINHRTSRTGKADQPTNVKIETETWLVSSQIKKPASTATSLEQHTSFCSGKITHQLNLMSAYNHQLDRLPDQPPAVTMHHRKASCTVDYIFYSVHRKRCATNQEGPLALLATYGLLSDEELRVLGGLPNAFQPSDHLPLMAKFLLQR